jgi:hypothetical protein
LIKRQRVRERTVDFAHAAAAIPSPRSIKIEHRPEATALVTSIVSSDCYPSRRKIQSQAISRFSLTRRDGGRFI